MNALTVKILSPKFHLWNWNIVNMLQDGCQLLFCKLSSAICYFYQVVYKWLSQNVNKKFWKELICLLSLHSFSIIYQLHCLMMVNYIPWFPWLHYLPRLLWLNSDTTMGPSVIQVYFQQSHEDGPSGLVVWGVGLDQLDTETMGSNPT
jgi:hypothetical protein